MNFHEFSFREKIKLNHFEKKSQLQKKKKKIQNNKAWH